MVQCLRCGAETVEGEVYVNVPESSTPMMGGMMPMPGMGMGNIGPPMEERLTWREKTGEKKGFLFKSDEVRTMTVRARRCTGCGHIELYVGDEV